MNLPNEYWSLAQRELQNRSSARARRMAMLNTIITQHYATTQTMLRLLESEIQNEREISVPTTSPSSRNTTAGTSARTPRSNNSTARTNTSSIFSPLHSDIRVVYTGLGLDRQGTGSSQQSEFTAEEVNQMTQLLPYDTSMNETRCPITWTNFTEGQDVLQIRSCGHVFEPEALRTWFQQNRRCPICRINPSTQSTRSETISPSSSASTISENRPTSSGTTNTNTNTFIEGFMEGFTESFLNSFNRSLANELGPNAQYTEYTVDLSDVVNLLRSNNGNSGRGSGNN